jgi:hypothetical protein
MLGSDPVPRRRQPWGALWSKAPWDGKPVVSTPVVAPAASASVAALRHLSDAPRSRVLIRTSFGKLMQNAPWTAKPIPQPSLIETPSPGLENTPPPLGQLNADLSPTAI